MKTSTFHLRPYWTWWQTNRNSKRDEEELFNAGAMCIANIDNSPKNEDKIVIGSFLGLLRIFRPEGSPYTPSSLLLETELDGGPILQVKSGHFLPGFVGTTLAVLHPNSLSVYLLEAKQSVASGETISLKKVHAYKFPTASFNFTHGRFGRQGEHDKICVQSIDGLLTFLDKGEIVFSKYLPGFLLPGPLCYMGNIDSFVTCSSAMNVQAFKYHTLAATINAGRKGSLTADWANDQAESPSASVREQQTGKTIQPTWQVVLGENAIDIVPGKFSAELSADEREIAVMGERNVYILSQNGEIRHQQHTESPPTCVHVYEKSNETKETATSNLIVVTLDRRISIYRHHRMIWMATMEEACVDLKIMKLNDIPGFIASISFMGHLQIGYMSTSSTPITVAPIGGNKSDMRLMQAEYENVQASINKAGRQECIEADGSLEISTKVEQFKLSSSHRKQPASMAATISLACSGHGRFGNVTLSYDVPFNYCVNKLSSRIPIVDSQNGNKSVPIRISLHPTAIPSLSNLRLFATYDDPTGSSHVRCHTIPCRQPLKIDMLPSPTLEKSKLVILTDQRQFTLTELYPEFNVTGTRIGARFGDGCTATIETAESLATEEISDSGETLGGFMVYADSMHMMFIVTEDLLNRLERFGSTITFPDPLPLADYFSIMDNHFELRNQNIEARKTLEDRCAQFRAIQKLLIAKHLERTPSNLNGLDTLMSITHNQIIKLADRIMVLQGELCSAVEKLTMATKLLILLLRFHNDLSEEGVAILEGVLLPRPFGANETGWEELTDLSITHLLKTCLARNQKDSLVSLPLLEVPESPEKLKKHIVLLCERLKKMGNSLKFDSL